MEDEAATSTPSVIQQWIVLVKSKFAHHVSEFDHEYLNLTTRSTEIPKQEYRTEKPGNIMSQIFFAAFVDSLC